MKKIAEYRGLFIYKECESAGGRYSVDVSQMKFATIRAAMRAIDTFLYAEEEKKFPYLR